MAYIQAEPGGAAVKTLFHEAENGRSAVYISLINLGEVLYQLEHRWGGKRLADWLGTLESLPLTVVDVTRARVYAAAHLKAHQPMAYGDTFAATLAEELDATLLTGDPEFQKVSDRVRIQWLPQPQR